MRGAFFMFFIFRKTVIVSSEVHMLTARSQSKINPYKEKGRPRSFLQKVGINCGGCDSVTVLRIVLYILEGRNNKVGKSWRIRIKDILALQEQWVSKRVQYFTKTGTVTHVIAVNTKGSLQGTPKLQLSVRWDKGRQSAGVCQAHHLTLL